MAKFNLNSEETNQEVIPNSWILTLRHKKTKTLRTVVFEKDVITAFLSRAKSEGYTFITLTNEERVHEFLAGNVMKAFQVNLNALRSRKVVFEPKQLYQEVEDSIEQSRQSETCSEIFEGSRLLIIDMYKTDEDTLVKSVMNGTKTEEENDETENKTGAGSE